MQVPWLNVIAKMIVWLSAEIALTVLGLDDIADYSEFIFQDRSGSPVTEIVISSATLVS